MEQANAKTTILLPSGSEFVVTPKRLKRCVHLWHHFHVYGSLDGLKLPDETIFTTVKRVLYRAVDEVVLPREIIRAVELAFIFGDNVCLRELLQRARKQYPEKWERFGWKPVEARPYVLCWKRDIGNLARSPELLRLRLKHDPAMFHRRRKFVQADGWKNDTKYSNVVFCVERGVLFALEIWLSDLSYYRGAEGVFRIMDPFLYHNVSHQFYYCIRVACEQDHWDCLTALLGWLQKRFLLDLFCDRFLVGMTGHSKPINNVFREFGIKC